MTKRICIFQEPTGYFFCSADLDYLDARGHCYGTPEEATRAALRYAEQEGSDVEYVTGSGVDAAVAAEFGVTVKD